MIVPIGAKFVTWVSTIDPDSNDTEIWNIKIDHVDVDNNKEFVVVFSLLLLNVLCCLV